MREHILDCQSVSSETRNKMQASEENRKAKAEAKKIAKRAHASDDESLDLSLDAIVQPVKKAKMDPKCVFFRFGRATRLKFKGCS